MRGDSDLLILKTYSAREKPIRGGHSRDLADYIGVQHFDTHAQLKKHIQNIAHEYDAIILMGAGDIDSVARELKREAQ